MTDRDVNDLCPELLKIYREWLMLCHEKGLAVAAIVTWRDGIDQDAAKANGLSNAAAGQSPHNCCDDAGLPASKAFDFGVFRADASYVREGEDPRYREAGEIGKSLGLVWGGDFKHVPPDYDHLELPDWKNA